MRGSDKHAASNSRLGIWVVDPTHLYLLCKINDPTVVVMEEIALTNTSRRHRRINCTH